MRVIAACMIGMSLASSVCGAIIKGPYLQEVTTTSVRVRWETDASAGSHVDYGPTGSYGSSVTATATSLDHGSTTYLYDAVLTPLGADALYHYRVDTGGSLSSDHTFSTAVSGIAFRFAAYGDTRSNPTVHQSLADAILACDPRFVLHVGDAVETDGGQTYSEWEDQFFTPAAGLFSEAPLYLAVGNHESSATHWVGDFIHFPNAPDRWYSFDYGATHLICLDTEVSYSDTSAQYDWLHTDLDAAASADLIVVFFHRPAYSSSEHGSEPDVDTYLVPLFESHGVDLVLNGHDHFYERSLKAGVNYVVTGAGGAPLYDSDLNPNPYRVYAASIYEFCMVDVSGTNLLLRANDSGGEMFDFCSAGGGDADGDGYSDAVEIRCAGDPADAAARPAAVKVNFQPSSSTRPDGFAADSCETFGAGGTNGIAGYGWVEP